ncbi:DUF4397 domain-containing protein [Sediminibacterium ginsengisoli]|uniref:DUF4397 domain-containing protein n=1 Tax=Sediminibacterium ginsengisoli TaxID=413434 RepID=A0A1T4LHH1_9BACT|nr:DUF4397 domain-containing protein [Sediminibacterium ginsengisoli]SJZ54165.1 protein of unknown function [Sediminibacterium ginsengisoli]
MKKYSFYILSALSLVVMLSACKKNTLRMAPFEYVDGTSLFKINYSLPYAKNPAVQLSIDGKRVSNNLTYSTPFPGGGLNTGGSNFADYLSLTPGEHTVTMAIPKVGTNVDSVELYKTTVNLEANKYQTLHMTDTAANTKSLLVTDESKKPDSGFTKYTFVNLIPGSQIDLYFGTVKVASGVNYLAKTDTFSIAAGTTLQWFIRQTGSSTNLAQYPTTNATTYVIPNQRVFTVYARGYLGYAITSTDIRRPMVSFLFNK